LNFKYKSPDANIIALVLLAYYKHGDNIELHANTVSGDVNRDDN